MLGRHSMLSAARRALSRLPFVALLVFAVVALMSAFMLLCRYEQSRRSGGGASPARSTAYGEELPSAGKATKNVTYTCIDAPGTEVSSPVTWDDGWFFESPYSYNHELARACSVFSALAYAESSHYQKSYRTPPYMERALGELGFSEVSTDSYQYRSEVMDQVLNLVTRQEDTVAYTLARKRVTGPDGGTRAVILVVVRGSYGSEWLSNLNIGTTTAERMAQQYNHSGYVEAADEIATALAPWVSESHERGDEVSLLLVGHSRGGAIANLVAAWADDELAQLAADPSGAAAALEAEAGDALGMAPGDTVAGYTFASPGCTTTADARAARYRNIFNVVNPADLVPQLPLASWGYARYGVDLCLPALDDEGFEDRYAAMKEAYAELTDLETGDPYDPDAVHAVQAVVDEVGAKVGSAAELATPAGVAAVAGACAQHINPARILCGHYPSVYISWMYAVDGDALHPAV